MEALFYETLIRNVYGSGRTNKNGANADIYKAMELAYRDYTVTKSEGSDYDREYEFQKCFATVRGNVRDTFEAGISRIDFSATAEDLTLLNEMKNKLSWTFYDKGELDRIIKEGTEIFHKYGLYQ